MPPSGGERRRGSSGAANRSCIENSESPFSMQAWGVAVWFACRELSIDVKVPPLSVKDPGSRNECRVRSELPDSRMWRPRLLRSLSTSRLLG